MINDLYYEEALEECQELKDALAELVKCCEMNTGAEPSVSCYHRALSKAKTLLDEGE